jgi:hypothetical protein
MPYSNYMSYRLSETYILDPSKSNRYNSYMKSGYSYDSYGLSVAASEFFSYVFWFMIINSFSSKNYK